MKNEKRTVFGFRFFMKWQLKSQNKNLLNMKIVASYLIFVLHIEVKPYFEK